MKTLPGLNMALLSPDLRECVKCGISRPLSYFYSSRKNANGTVNYHSYCSYCRTHYANIRYYENSFSKIPAHIANCKITESDEERLIRKTLEKKALVAGQVCYYPVDCENKDVGKLFEWVGFDGKHLIRRKGGNGKSLGEKVGHFSRSGKLEVGVGIKKELVSDLVWKYIFKRDIAKNEYLVHINGDETDNSLDNLEIRTGLLREITRTWKKTGRTVVVRPHLANITNVYKGGSIKKSKLGRKTKICKVCEKRKRLSNFYKSTLLCKPCHRKMLAEKTRKLQASNKRKLCVRCKRTRPTSEYVYGRRICKKCRGEETIETRRKTGIPERKSAACGWHRICSLCNKKKSLKHFYKKGHASGYCKKCEREYLKEYERIRRETLHPKYVAAQIAQQDGIPISEVHPDSIRVHTAVMRADRAFKSKYTTLKGHI